MRDCQWNETRPHTALIVGLGMCWAGNALSAEVSAELSAGVGVSDNIFLTGSGETNETLGIAGLVFKFDEKTRKLNASIRSNFDYRYYKDESFDNELVGGLDGQVDITLIEERLTWLARDNFGQQYANSLEAARPDNNEDVNYFTTGPSLTLPFGSVNSFDIDLRYSTLSYETRPLDNSRGSAAVRLVRNIRQGVYVSVNATTDRVEYDGDGLSRDFDRHEGFLRYASTSGRNTVGLDVGYTEVEVDTDTESGDGLLLRANWARIISPFSTFRVSGGARYSDQGDIFRFEQENTDDLREPLDADGVGIPFRNYFFDAKYSLIRGRTEFYIAASWNKEDYEGILGLDRDLLKFDVFVSRDLTRRIYSELEIGYRDRDYKLLFQNDDIYGKATVGYRFGTALNVSLQYQYRDRDSDNLSDYFENRLFLRVAYIPAWGR